MVAGTGQRRLPGVRRTQCGDATGPLIEIVKQTLSDIESMAQGYGVPITNPEHPWYETAERLRRVSDWYPAGKPAKASY